MRQQQSDECHVVSENRAKQAAGKAARGVPRCRTVSAASIACWTDWIPLNAGDGLTYPARSGPDGCTETGGGIGLEETRADECCAMLIIAEEPVLLEREKIATWRENGPT